MTHSESIVNLVAALAKAQATMGSAHKSADNPYYHTRYADLASVWDACRQSLTENGLAVVQVPVFLPDQPDWVFLDTRLFHETGEWIESRLGAKPFKATKGEGGVVLAPGDAQAIGSALTYLRRYALSAMVGVAPADDDGEAATGRNPDRPAPATRAKPATQAKASPQASAQADLNKPLDVAEEWKFIFRSAKELGFTEAQKTIVQAIAKGPIVAKGGPKDGKDWTAAQWDLAREQFGARAAWVNKCQAAGLPDLAAAIHQCSVLKVCWPEPWTAEHMATLDAFKFPTAEEARP